MDNNINNIKKKVLIIIPAYNEEKNLPLVFDDIARHCNYCKTLVINDCSTDGTAVLCEERGVQRIDLPINLGIGGAVQTGFKYAVENFFDIAIQMDGDAQHNATYITDLIDCINSGSNVCIGSRFLQEEGFKSTKFRRIGIRFYTGLLQLLTGKRYTDPTSGFRAFDFMAMSYFINDYSKDFPEPEIIVLLNAMGLDVKEVPVVMNEREHGKSSITVGKTVYYFVKVTLSMLLSRLVKKV